MDRRSWGLDRKLTSEANWWNWLISHETQREPVKLASLARVDEKQAIGPALLSVYSYIVISRREGDTIVHDQHQGELRDMVTFVSHIATVTRLQGRFSGPSVVTFMCLAIASYERGQGV